MKLTFTKFSLFFLSTVFFNISLYAQTTKGLEKVIVERYYVSNAADASASAGTLPVGSVTWRVYLDLLPGYKFLAAFGDKKHTLSITTKTSFFNNEDRGSTTADYSKTNAAKNTVMLDSWLTAGAACAGNFGILKSEDNGVATVVNAQGVLKNADPKAGLPLTTQDGLIAGKPGLIGFLGLENVIGVFDATSQAGNNFTVTDGTWYCLEGAMGPDSAKNKVLIAQLTTDGELSFKLNVTIGKGDGKSEFYVAENPGYRDGAIGEAPILELLDSTLTFNSSKVTGPVTNVTNEFVKNEISVYPNPTRNIFHIAFTADFTEGNYTIYNIAGNRIQTKNITKNRGRYDEKVDLSNYPNGIYFVKIQSKAINSTFKIIKRE